MNQVDFDNPFWAKTLKGTAENPDLQTCWFFVAGDGRPRNTSELAWKLSRGSPPSSEIRHTCRDSYCCNPEHLTTSHAQVDRSADRHEEQRCTGQLNFDEQGGLIDHDREDEEDLDTQIDCGEPAASDPSMVRMWDAWQPSCTASDRSAIWDPESP